ncbi:MAG: leucine-rich repeat protein [Bacilli bacterium]|nr:leucine-rich repeat protein [Bacilli bacterium]
MNRKAFTLIELLAVIVVLAIILVISIPRILKVIENSQIESIRVGAENLVKAASDRLLDLSFNVPVDKKYTISGGIFVGDSIPYNGTLPDQGIIYVTYNGYVAIMLFNGTLCAKKEFNEKRVSVTKDSICILNVPESVDESCFDYSSSVTEATVIGYDLSCSKNVIIPSTLGGKTLTIIGSSAFDNIGLTSVIIPNTVNTIGSNSFQNNFLKSIILPNSVTTISSYAFSGNIINNINIPTSVNTIGVSAFENNQLTNLSISNGVESIEERAFYGNQLTSLSIPSTVNSIGIEAFVNNSIVNINMPSLVDVSSTSISNNFYNSYVTSYSRAAGNYTSTCQTCIWSKS